MAAAMQDVNSSHLMRSRTRRKNLVLHLGWIRLGGLDRMRVTLKAEVINCRFQHYLVLIADWQEKVRKLLPGLIFLVRLESLKRRFSDY
jgi:hypothetical protein